MTQRLIRPAVMDDAPQGVAVLRSSITELCVAVFHPRNDPWEKHFELVEVGPEDSILSPPGRASPG